MTEADLSQVRKLNNAHIKAVGEVTQKKFKYLFSRASHAFVVKDQGMVVAFLMAQGKGIDYNSKNYLWHAG